MHKFTIDNKTGVIEFNTFNYLYISQNRNLNLDRSIDYTAIIVEGKNADFARMAIKRIRSNHNPEIYLKPILILNGTVAREAPIRELIDGMIYSFDQLEIVERHILEILDRVKEIQLVNSVSMEAQLITKLMVFMYTRNQKRLEPIPSVHSNTNYTFPFLALHFDFKEEYLQFELLEIARSEGLLNNDFFDRTYFCSNCKSSCLSMREVCPKCNSSNSETYDVVHHFPCAYVGPITDFQNSLDDALNCPKCSKRLRHIGVDYDKPSVLHHCKKCLNSYQDYFVHARCMSCSFDNPVEALIPVEINAFNLTRKGEYAALYGFVHTPKDIEQIIGTVKQDTFKTMVKFEIERIKQTEGISNIIGVNIVNSSHVYSKIGSKAQQELLKDIVSVVRSNIRSSDAITFHSSSLILISMYDIPLRIAENITRDILVLLKKLIDNNFNDLAIDLVSNIRQLNIQLSGELQIEQLINLFNQDE